MYTSDQHYGVGSNLILPGRGENGVRWGDLVNYIYIIGKDMGDGWETKRSREKGHKDWVIIQLYVWPTAQMPVLRCDVTI